MAEEVGVSVAVENLEDTNSIQWISPLPRHDRCTPSISQIYGRSP
jgi:hypothetical protein